MDNNLNALLGNLSDTVFNAICDGKTEDDIAKELGVDKPWIAMIVSNLVADEQRVLDIIKNDKDWKISGMESLSKMSGLSVNRLESILNKLLKSNKVSFIALYGRKICPDKIDGSPMDVIKLFIEHHFGDIVKGLSSNDVKLVKKNIDNLLGCKTDTPEYEQLELPEEEPPVVEEEPVIVKEPVKENNGMISLKKNNSWSEIEINTLIYMIESSYSIDKMAHVLGKDKEVVQKKRYTLLSAGIVSIKKSSAVTSDDEPSADKPIKKVNDSSTVERYMPNKYKIWSDEDVEKLKAMLEAGKSTVEIAVALNRPSKETVEQKIYQLRKKGLLPPAEQIVNKPKIIKTNEPWTDEEIEILKKLAETGCASEDIAQILGRPSANAVDIMICRLRAQGKIELMEDVRRDTPYARGWTTDEEEHVIQLRKEGYTIKAIAKEIGRSYTQVNAKIYRLREMGRFK